MAARLNPRHQTMVRDKIQTTQLINRLTKHALGEVELTSAQVRSIEILLKKSIPDLSAVQVDGKLGLSFEDALRELGTGTEADPDSA